MKALSRNDDDPKFRRMVIRDGLILLAINLFFGIGIVVALFFSIKGEW